ncbi:MAG: dihydroxyacetone kinase subunit DhaK [Actinomycetota bacterium]|nr:dihydroxyacetone kinase subunit DhaK [Actinomycetota bacterium]
MKKIINEPEKFVDQMLEGILAAYPQQLKCLNDDLRCIVDARPRKANKVGLVTGGGSGHLPLFLGYVGEGMLDGCAVGDIFASPSANQILEITRDINTGAGVLYVYGNYSGDRMNFDMAREMAEMEDIAVEQVIVTDDVASAPRGQEEKRRGVAGLFFVYKIASAYAQKGATLKEVKDLAQKVNSKVRTMGVGLSPCIIPEAGKPTFQMEEGQMEIGIGIHGEAGMGKDKLKSADKITESMMEAILDDLNLNSGHQVSVLVNGLGATPREELYVVYRKVFSILKDKNITVFNPYIDEFATSLEMAGMSITLLPLDQQLKELLAAPAETPFFKQF